MRQAAALVCVLLTVVACGSEPAPPTDPNSIDAAPELTLVEELRLGSFDDPDLGFSRIADVAVDSHGNVYAFEAGASEIRVFDPAGNPLRTIGREGEGPGEFSGTPRFGIRNDTLWAVDRTLSRITLFDRAGAVLSAQRFDAVQLQVRTGFASLMPVLIGEDGHFPSWLMSVTSPADDSDHTEQRDSVPIPIVRFDAGGNVIDTAGWLPRPPPRLVPPAGGGSRFGMLEVDGARYRIPDPPSILPSWSLETDGYTITEVPFPESGTQSGVGAFTVTRIEFGGDTIFHRRLLYAPEPYTSRDLDELAEVYVDTNPRAESDAGHRATALRQVRAAMDFPTHRPGVDAAEVLSDGSVWIPRALSGDDSLTRWIVLDPDGSIRGRVRFSARTQPRWSDGATVWMVEYDDFNVPWLVRYRIEP